ncbi:thioesterase superfamily protein [Thermosinus carboxydivorans Nor1]|uniref:Thioesterase superfamily protein n=1 Tax=Thermosinus carboxydivorans Nor1 TaxID=401526 RepID=A1HQF0_9FIRM|nr:thioesterase family protein [Thermosinus carboxydivorans]EAX47757.1 thioesterase superfamily protein [Thermosinus carboxydivorans Nor1]
MVTVRDKVRFVETDMMGVVHHSNYFRWFEMGRVEYLRQAGIYLLDLMDQGILFPITDVSCQYRASARFDDYILIETELVEVSRVKMVFAYRVVREADGVLLATGRTQNVFTDQNGKIIRLPQAIYAKLAQAAQRHIE